MNIYGMGTDIVSIKRIGCALKKGLPLKKEFSLFLK